MRRHEMCSQGGQSSAKDLEAVARNGSEVALFGNISSEACNHKNSQRSLPTVTNLVVCRHTHTHNMLAGSLNKCQMSEQGSSKQHRCGRDI
jgi:hypothetical protein